MTLNSPAIGQVGGLPTCPTFFWQGAPTNGVTGAKIIPPGALLCDQINGTLYQNTGTLASPIWTQISGGGGGSLSVTDGITTVSSTTTVDFTSGGTVTSGGAGVANVAISGGGGGVSLPLPFFGTSNPPWVRPALNIGGPSSAFNTWLNQGGQAYAIGNGTQPVAPGSGYLVGDTWTAAGGTLAAGGSATVLTLTDIQGVSATIVNPGNSGVPGSALVQTTTGTGTPVQFNVTISALGAITSIDSVATPGDLSANLTDPTNEPMVAADASNITGAVFSILFGAFQATITDSGLYSVNPPSAPATQGATSGSGTGLTWDLSYSALATVTDGAGGLPLAIQADGIVGFSTGYLTGLLKPIGAPPWTITVGIAGVQTGKEACFIVPLILYNSSGHKAVVLEWSPNYGAWQISHYSTVIGDSSSAVSPAGVYTVADYFAWFRVVNDGANVIFSVSAENVVFLELYRESATAYVASFDFAGYGVEPASVPSDSYAGSILTALWNWVQT